MKKIVLIMTLLFASIIMSAQSTATTVSPGIWSNPSTWDIGVPSTGDNVIINHSILIDTKNTVNNITVNQTTFCSDTLFITGVLNLENDIFSSTIVFVNDSINKGRLGQTSNGQIIGDFVWQKWIERCDGWAIYGGPFNTPLVNYGFIHSGFPGTNWPTFWLNTYYYDETIPDVDSEIGWYPPGNVNDILPRGQGFFLFDSSSSATNQPRSIEMEGSIDLTENFNYNVTYSGSPAQSLNNGWCMVSNPYPGTIDWDAAGWTKIKMDNAIWVWNNCNNNYASYIDGIGVNGGIPYVSAGQGFWIKTDKPNPFLYSTRSVISDQNEELKKSIGHDGLVRISLNGDEIALSLNDSSTNLYDIEYDAYKFLSENSKLYTKIDTFEYSINSILDKDTIPLYVIGSGMLNFDLSELTKIPTIYYQDVQTGIVYDATTNPQHNFTSTAVVFNHRFNIIIPHNITTISEEPTIKTNRELVNTYNLLGQVVDKNYNGIIIEIYSDGSARKVYRQTR